MQEEAIELTPKQRLFCLEYMVDLNATQAAIRAGYSEKTAKEIGCENLTKPNIAKFIDRMMKERGERVQISQDYVLRTIKDTMERCRQASPVLNRDGTPLLVETEDGEVVPAYTFEPNAVLKGAELLGKHLKLFTDKVEVGGNGASPILVQILDDIPRKTK